MIIKSIALFLLIISLFFNLAHALSIEEKIDIIFNKLESTYGEYLTISDLTTSSDDNYYYRSYPSVVELIRIEKHSSEIWYFIEGEWKYFSTLDDANTFLCDGGCYEILSESRSPSPDPIDSPIEGESFLPIDNINRNIGEAFVPSQLDGGTDSSRERTFSGIKSIHGNYYPLSAIVKIFFKDRKGKATVCSGSMVEKDIVLTAGHCVHSDGAWMDQRTFTIIPAYDASVFNSEPFGRAGAVNLRALKGWIKNEDYKYDVGIIFLDKNIGNKTGWFGVKPHDNFLVMQNKSYYILERL